MIVPHSLGVDEQVRSELTKEPAPGGVGKSCVRAKLTELTHHRRLSGQRRVQAANYFKQEPIRVIAAIDCGGRRQSVIVLGRRDQRSMLIPI